MTLKQQTLQVHVQNRTYMLKRGTATNAAVRGQILRFKFLALVAMPHTTPSQVSSLFKDIQLNSNKHLHIDLDAMSTSIKAWPFLQAWL